MEQMRITCDWKWDYRRHENWAERERKLHVAILAYYKYNPL
ncbi:hypothetical protein CCACVL1_16671 [Corchorus capsularis]|uniref:Uncharacterized protein n=1 Tax=Corchorus capsularis TaxID=210143 RepID=A0A1R3HW20_COCAP|nr:hypothetical protein CCACVL1_16671 [Corchorus capsularis]